MSIQTTPFLHLPQWTAEEQPSFLGEINPAWAAIDEGYGDIKTSAGTAITTANAAVNTANDAKSQSQANAGVITQLQQQIAQLQGKINEQSNLVTDTPSVTTTHSGVEVSAAIFFHNGYVATGHFVIYFEVGNYTFNQNTPLLTVTGLPYVWKNIVINTSKTFGPNDNIKVYNQKSYDPMSTRLESNGNLFTVADIEVINSRQRIDLMYSIPIFRSTSNRNDMPEQCAFLN